MSPSADVARAHTDAHGIVDPGGDASRGWFFDALLDASSRAERSAGLRERFLRVAGFTVALRFRGPALEEILWSAFAHLACEQVASPDLAIAFWDDSSTGIVTPEPPGSPGRVGLDFVDGPVRLAWEPSRRALSGYDPARRLGLVRFPDASNVEAWERSAPARRVLHWWAADHGCQLVHASAVGTPDGGVLLAGRGGSGKSTTALACIGSGLGYAADDYCLVSPGGERRVHSLYGTGKADAGSIERLPGIRSAFERSTLRVAGKTVIGVAQEFPAAMIASMPLRAVVVPRLGASTPRLSPIAPVAALRALAPSTMMQLPGDRAGTLDRLARLVRGLPCFELELGADPADAVLLLAGVARGEVAP